MAWGLWYNMPVNNRRQQMGFKTYQVTVSEKIHGLLESLYKERGEWALLNRGEHVGPCVICGTHVSMEEATPTVWHGDNEIDGPVCMNCVEQHCEVDHQDGEYVLREELPPAIRANLRLGAMV
jgi:hypothetical protein